jgi:hypothetical protein
MDTYMDSYAHLMVPRGANAVAALMPLRLSSESLPDAQIAELSTAIESLRLALNYAGSGSLEDVVCPVIALNGFNHCGVDERWFDWVLRYVGIVGIYTPRLHVLVASERMQRPPPESEGASWLWRRARGTMFGVKC